MLTAEQIMTPNVVTIPPTTTIQEAIDLLVVRRISGLPITDEAGRLVGIITEFALLAMAYDKNVQSDPVERHMTRDVITVSATDSLSRITDLFILHRVRRLPVVKDGRLVGLVSRQDVLAALSSQQAPICSA